LKPFFLIDGLKMSTILEGHGTVTTEKSSNAAGSNSSYCYLFEDLAHTEAELEPASCKAYFEDLRRLADQMDLHNPAENTASTLPAIYTYFGQFINHDLSAPTATPRYMDSISSLALKTDSRSEIVSAGVDVIALMAFERPSSPNWLVENIVNQHPQALCLYSLYGTGPLSSDLEICALYDQNTMKFRLGKTLDQPSPSLPQHELDKMLRHDLVRDGGVAKIADRRNDGNLIISQLHLAFMLFHNRAIDALAPLYPNKTLLFAEARKLVTLHYQHCVLHDYLKHLVPNEALGAGLQFSKPNVVPFEFTTAAFRFGHSMISQTYDFNRFFSKGGLAGKMATLGDLFRFTSKGRMDGSGGALPTHWVIDWERFFQATQNHGSRAEQIDLVFPPNMAALGDLATPSKMESGLASIAHRNLKRGYHRFMPSGQDVAKKLGLVPLSPAQIKSAFPRASAAAVLTETGFDTKTPMWVYFLCEAKVLAGGNVLGPAAGTIIRGTISSLITQSRRSLLGSGAQNWTPQQSPLRLADGRSIVDIKSFLQFATTV
jgi:Animal haem peroxidase